MDGPSGPRRSRNRGPSGSTGASKRPKNGRGTERFSQASQGTGSGRAPERFPACDYTKRPEVKVPQPVAIDYRKVSPTPPQRLQEGRPRGAPRQARRRRTRVGSQPHARATPGSIRRHGQVAWYSSLRGRGSRLVDLLRKRRRPRRLDSPASAKCGAQILGYQGALGKREAPTRSSSCSPLSTTARARSISF